MNPLNDYGILIVKRTLTLALVTIAAASLLGGCGFMRSKFGNKNDAYKNSTQSRPLEVPPDLERPNSTGTLTIPEPTNRGTAGESSDAVERVPAIGAVASSNGSDGFVVEDTVESTWSRVGLALERSGVASIQERDADAHTYELRAAGKTRKPAGWLKRVVTFGKASGKRVTTPVTLKLRVLEGAGGSQIVVESAGGEAARDAARNVIEVLRQRMS